MLYFGTRPSCMCHVCRHGWGRYAKPRVWFRRAGKQDSYRGACRGGRQVTGVSVVGSRKYPGSSCRNRRAARPGAPRDHRGSEHPWFQSAHLARTGRNGSHAHMGRSRIRGCESGAHVGVERVTVIFRPLARQQVVGCGHRVRACVRSENPRLQPSSSRRCLVVPDATTRRS